MIAARSRHGYGIASRGCAGDGCIGICRRRYVRHRAAASDGRSVEDSEQQQPQHRFPSSPADGHSHKEQRRQVAPPTVMIPFNGLLCGAMYPVAVDAADAAVVLTLSVAVTAAVPVINAGGVTEQLGGSTAPAGPVTKPPAGVIVIIEVPLAPGDAILTAVLLNAKLGTVPVAATVNGMGPKIPPLIVVVVDEVGPRTHERDVVHRRRRRLCLRQQHCYRITSCLVPAFDSATRK
jgi:hypothetical protein